jgi:hypothetical protein
MLRHPREMTRHHRQRVIQKRLHQYKKWFNWIPEKTGMLSKQSLHHHHCEYCNGPYYKRERFDWRNEIAQ